MMAEAFYPDGQREILCAVPNYDFNWQTTYTYTNPPYLPAGTRLRVSALHDNTKDNPNNPDPNARVTWGQSTFDEMMHGWTDFVYADEEGVWPATRRREVETSESSERLPPRTATDEETTIVAAADSRPENVDPPPAPRYSHPAATMATRASDVKLEKSSLARMALVGVIGGLALLALFLVVRSSRIYPQ